MTALLEPESTDAPEVKGPGRVRRGLRAAVIPIVTTFIAFIVAGLVVLLTGHNPFSTYGAIFDGTGLNYIFPWVTGQASLDASFNLQQTLVTTCPLILVGLSVAFAFRAGLFNIGAQGQYTVGGIMAVWVGSSWNGLPGWLHIIVAITLAALVGAAWAGLAGWLKAVTGAHEVITTIMLNYVALWIGVYLFQEHGPLQGPHANGDPSSALIANNAHLPVIWGSPLLQGLHIGIFIALAAAVLYWVLLNRSTLGYEVRAVGHNPVAAQAAGISVARQYIRTMAICGAFAGLAASMDVLGYQFQLSTTDLQVSQTGFLGIAVALLGRNTAVGTVLAALLFGALETGTSVRNLDPSVFNPELAGNLTLMIEGLVVLLVSTDIIAIRLLGLPSRLKWVLPKSMSGSWSESDSGPAAGVAAADLPGQGAGDEPAPQVGDDAAGILPEDDVISPRTAGL
jgi:ABC-type uncharacterized transport system permease subunit